MRKNLRSWVLVAGLLAILGACIGAYISTRPAEADVSRLMDPPMPAFGKAASALFSEIIRIQFKEMS